MFSLNFGVFIPFLYFYLGQMSRHFELLNYSEHGTVVDNVVYCCDLDMDAITVKSDPEDVKEKEKKPSFQGLDDLTKRNGDRMTNATSLTESNEVNFFEHAQFELNEFIDLRWFGLTVFSLWMSHRRQLS